MSYEQFAIALAFLAGLYLLRQAWAWCAFFSIAALASFLVVVTSLIQFEILAALGFFLLGSALSIAGGCIYEFKIRRDRLTP